MSATDASSDDPSVPYSTRRDERAGRDGGEDDGAEGDDAGGDGIGRDGAGEDGAGGDGIGRAVAGEDCVGRDGIGRDGAGRDGAGEDGVGRAVAGGDGPGRDGTTGETSGGSAAGGEQGYYGMPIVKPHVWKDSIAWYFFFGGLSGAASVLAAVAEASGRDRLAVHARRASIVGLLPSPALLIDDLGRPWRFLNMLRVFKPSSPMSVGTWALSAHSALSGGAFLLGETGRLAVARRPLTMASGLTGAVMPTYTAVLLGDTATPMWAKSRTQLPWLFVSGAAASAGAATALLSMVERGRPNLAAHRLAVVGVAGERVTSEYMERKLGDLDTRQTDPAARRYARAARTLNLVGAALSLVGRRRRWLTAAGFGAMLAGALSERLAIIRGGAASAKDPAAVVRLQTEN